MTTLLPNIFPVTCHTSHVGPGSTFVAIKGLVTDATVYIPEALEKGATEIVVEDSSYTEEIASLCDQYNAACLRVPDARKALAEMARERLGAPSDKLTIIGITGTKGKSTTAYLLHHILRQADYKTALISTIANKILDQAETSKRTTPENDYLQMFFAECVAKKVTHVVMEVSSQALDLQRVHTLQFDAIGFTNLAPEHLDYHHTMEAYFAVKAELFKQVKANGIVVINSDNDWGIAAYKEARSKAPAGTNIITFGTEASESGDNHIGMAIHKASCDGIEVCLDLKPMIFLECPQLMGSFNCYNITMATIIAHHLGVPYTFLCRSLRNFPGVPGRLQKHVLKNGALAYVDYAHNPSSTKEVLSTLRPYTQDLIVVIGCGGNRDATKRPVMGRLAAEYGDKVILTSDNPRTENPDDIIDQMIADIPQELQKKVIRQTDRRTAIAEAARFSHARSIIAILGKGHETYYECLGVVTHLDDMEEIRKF